MIGPITHPTDININADIAANPNPWLETKAISTKSRFLLKYWPTIRVAGFLVIATPKPRNKNQHFILIFQSKYMYFVYFTYHETITKEELMKLSSEWGKQTAQSRY